jgi:hypothetical protein
MESAHDPEGATAMSTNGSALEQGLRSRIGAGGFAIALSGGGHRATLATLGALMAIVDRGLGPRVIQIASVSGGSITNAFIAQRCELDKLGPEGLDNIATELASTIIQKGVLTRPWILGLLLTPFVLGIITGIVLHLIIAWTSIAVWMGILVFITALSTVFITSGRIVDWLLNRRYFHHAVPAKGRRDHARLSSLSGRSIDHVFCMTDQVLGLPVYASSQQCGMIWRRLDQEPSKAPNPTPQFQTFQSDLSITKVVRASAAFPGIAPFRMKIPPDPQIPLVNKLSRQAFLADGGLWNNLGSQALREDGLIGTYAAWEKGVLRPPLQTSLVGSIPLLCVNGSAPLRPTRPYVFQIPGAALIKSLLQVTTILDANTVFPRVQAMRRAFEDTIRGGRRPGYSGHPADLISDLRAVQDTVRDHDFATLGPDQIRESDPLVM